jgi:phosphate transport system permease protein
LFYEAKLSISKFSIHFLFNTTWDPVREEFGGLVPILGTILTSVLAILLAFPISLGIAIFISEICPKFLKNFFRVMIELLAGIPSIIYGMWGLFVFVPIMKNKIEPFLSFLMVSLLGLVF